MRKSRVARIALVLAVLAPLAATAPGKSPRQCTSSDGDFSTVCPSAWHRIDWFGDTISLLSFPPSQSEHGVIIKHGGAQIIIGKHPLEGMSFADWIRRDNRNLQVVRDPVTLRLAKNRVCDEQSFLEVKDGGSPSEIDSEIYCLVGKSVFKFWVRSWSDDPTRQTYKPVLARMFARFELR